MKLFVKNGVKMFLFFPVVFYIYSIHIMGDMPTRIVPCKRFEVTRHSSVQVQVVNFNVHQ